MWKPALLQTQETDGTVGFPLTTNAFLNQGKAENRMFDQ